MRRDIGVGLAALSFIVAACQTPPSLLSESATNTAATTPDVSGGAQVSAEGDLSAAAAVALVDRYERALEASNAQAAWSLLSPTFRAVALGSDYGRFAAERGAFIAAAGPAYTLFMRGGDATVLRPWALPRLTADADLSNAYLVEAHYPSLTAAYPAADPICSSDFFLAASGSGGGWWLWWVGDTSGLTNGSCSRSTALFFTPQPGPRAPIATEADAVRAAEADASIVGPFQVGGVVKGLFADLWQGSMNDPSGAGASQRAADANKVVWRVDLTGPYGSQQLYVEASTGTVVSYIVQGR